MMRSRSRSRSRRQRMSGTGSRALVRHRKSDQSRSEKFQSRSTSKTRRGVASKRKSDSHRGASALPKRRHRDVDRGTKQKEVPRKREADSTDSPAKNKVRRDSPSPSTSQRRPKHKASDTRERKKHSDKSSKRQRESVEEGEIDESQNVERPFDQTDVTLDDRFTSTTSKTKPFIPDENVTIEIERSVAGRAVPFAIPPFWSDAVQIVRRTDEGKKPLNDREEFLRRIEDSDDERRVVKVKKSSVPENFDVRRDRNQADGRRTLSSKDGRSRRDESSRHVEDRRRERYAITRRVGDGGNYQANVGLVVTRNRGDSDGRSRPIQRSVTASVGRQFLLPAAAAMAGNLRTEHVHPERDRTAAPNANFLSGYQSMPAMTMRPPELPDFAHRPDKYSYEEWKDRPELIPKGRSYYEHDDRDANDDWYTPRFRGRGGFGGRPRGRGFSRGFGRGSFDARQRPPFRSRSPFSGGGEWKHDKFEELEATEPTSETMAAN